MDIIGSCNVPQKNGEENIFSWLCYDVLLVTCWYIVTNS